VRKLERAVAEPLRRDDAQGQSDELRLPLDPGLGGGGRSDVLRLERQLGRGEFLLDDEEVLVDGLDEAARLDELDGQAGRTGLGLDVDPDEGQEGLFPRGRPQVRFVPRKVSAAERTEPSDSRTTMIGSPGWRAR